MDDFSKMQVLVLSSDEVHMKDEDGGRIDGVSIMYTFNSSLTPLVNSDTSNGQKVAKAFLQNDQIHNIVNVPGLYDCEFMFRVGRDGKPTLAVKTIDFISSVCCVPCGNANDIDKVKEYAKQLLNDKKH